MSADTNNDFLAREGLEGNEAGRDCSGEHRHPAGNPIEARSYFILVTPVRLFRAGLWLGLAVCLLDLVCCFDLPADLLCIIKNAAAWVKMSNAICWLWIVRVTEIDIEPEGECQTLSEDEEDEA